MRGVQLTERVDIEQQEADGPIEPPAAIQLTRTGLCQVGRREQLGQTVLAALSPDVRQVEHPMNQPQRGRADRRRPGCDQREVGERQAHEQQHAVGEQSLQLEHALVARRDAVAEPDGDTNQDPIQDREGGRGGQSRAEAGRLAEVGSQVGLIGPEGAIDRLSDQARQEIRRGVERLGVERPPA